MHGCYIITNCHLPQYCTQVLIWHIVVSHFIVQKVLLLLHTTVDEWENISMNEYKENYPINIELIKIFLKN